MTKNPEYTKHASEIARAQDSIRSTNEELIKLSQRLGRMMPKLQRLETSGIITWFSIYNRIKDCASKADDEAIWLLNKDSVTQIQSCSTSLDTILAERQGFTLKWKSWTTSLTG